VTRLIPEDQDFDPDAFSAEDAERSFREGIELFDAARYHAAHEAFERCWLANEGSDADFFKGLIQAAICMHHFAEGNLEGAKKLHAGQRRLLAPFLPAHRGLDLVAFLAEMQRVIGPATRDPGRAFDPALRPRLDPRA
jgi:predicted metal-dependent hydrolase